MSLTFPLSTAAFFDLLQLSAFTMPSSFGRETSGLGSGKIIEKDLRPQLWTARAQSIDLDYDTHADQVALIEAVIARRGTFYAYDIAKKYPRNDPDGSILGSNTVLVADVSGNFALKFSGLPAAYVISRGDLFAYHDGLSQMLYRSSETVTADGAGDTAFFEVTPKLSTATSHALSSSPALVVDLIKPTAEMMIVPGTFTQTDGRSDLSRAFSFQAIQVRN